MIVGSIRLDLDAPDALSTIGSLNSVPAQTEVTLVVGSKDVMDAGDPRFLDLLAEAVVRRDLYLTIAGEPFAITSWVRALRERQGHGQTPPVQSAPRPRIVR